MSKRQNGEGMIFRYRDRWAAQLTVGGRRKTYYGKTVEEVQAKLNVAKVQRQEGRLLADPSQRVSTYLNAWLGQLESLGAVRPSTLRTYRLNVKRLNAELGNVTLEALRPPHVQAAYNALSARGLAPRTVRQVHLTLHKALADAGRLELVIRNVSEATTRPRINAKEMNWYPAEDLARLFITSRGDRYHALWVVLGTVGLRLGEARGLKWGDIDTRAGTLAVRRTLQRVSGAGLVFGEPKSESSRRTVELPPTALDALEAHRDLQTFERKRLGEVWQDFNLVFPSEIGTPLEHGRIELRWHQAIKVAGIPRYRIHDLRHSVATHLLAGGMQPLEVAATLGHSNAALVLQTYGHVIPSSRQRAASIMQDILGGTSR